MKIPPFPGELKKEKVGRNRQYVLDKEQREWLCKNFPEYPNDVLLEVSGLSHNVMHKYARMYGLTKSVKGMRKIKKMQTRHMMQTCKKNGYYERIKGKQPSKECQEGARKMWDEIHSGKRDSPIVKLKKTNPKRFKKIIDQRSNTLKEVFVKERRRIFYGLERKTKINVVLQPYRKSQINHRNNAIHKYGYILVDDCSEDGGERWNIYYDEDTRRSEKFERNLKKDGFHVLQWE